MEDQTKPGSQEDCGSLTRVSKIPIIEATINKTTEFYGMLKESSGTVNSVLTSAENAVKRGTEMAQPVTSKLEGPMKKVDSAFCTGLDYVEEKVPAIKLPPNEAPMSKALIHAEPHLSEQPIGSLTPSIATKTRLDPPVASRLVSSDIWPGLAQKTKEALNTNVLEPAMKGVQTISEYGKQKVASFTQHNQDQARADNENGKK